MSDTMMRMLVTQSHYSQQTCTINQHRRAPSEACQRWLGWPITCHNHACVSGAFDKCNMQASLTVLYSCVQAEFKLLDSLHD